MRKINCRRLVVYYCGESEEEFKKLIGVDGYYIDSVMKPLRGDIVCNIADFPEWMQSETGYYYGYRIIKVFGDDNDYSK